MHAPDHTLTKKGFWLRNRAGRFELKIPLEARDGNGMDKYEELEDGRVDRERLGLPTGENFVDAARGAGYVHSRRSPPNGPNIKKKDSLST